MLDNAQIEKILKEYIAGVLHMSLATCADNKPWISEVHFVLDDDINLYWRSKESRRHSQEIARNPNVAGNIVEQHDLNTNPRGAYFEGQAQSSQLIMSKIRCISYSGTGLEQVRK